MTKPTSTPRTDAKAWRTRGHRLDEYTFQEGAELVTADFARALELALARRDALLREADQRFEELSKLLPADHTWWAAECRRTEKTWQRIRRELGGWSVSKALETKI